MKAGDKYLSSTASRYVAEVRFVDDDGSVTYRNEQGRNYVCSAVDFGRWFDAIPRRYVVELRAPRPGEQFLIIDRDDRNTYPVVIEELPC